MDLKMPIGAHFAKRRRQEALIKKLVLEKILNRDLGFQKIKCVLFVGKNQDTQGHMASVQLVQLQAVTENAQLARNYFSPKLPTHVVVGAIKKAKVLPGLLHPPGYPRLGKGVNSLTIVLFSYERPH